MRSIGTAWIVATAVLGLAQPLQAQPAQAQPAQAQSHPDGQPLPELPARTTVTPLVDQRAVFQEPTRQAQVPVGAVEDLNGPGGIETVTSCPDGSCYNTFGCYDEACCRSRLLGSMWKFKNMLYGGQMGGGGPCDGYQCANCYGMLDIEKRIFLGYVDGNATKTTTRAGVNDLDGAQVAAEFLPWVLQDGSEVFTRWGFTVMYQYSRFQGNPTDQFRSRASGGLLSVDGGDMHSLVLGATYRLDTDILGVRFSPNATIGGTFDWVDLDPARGRGGPTFPLDSFNLTGFDCGFYSRLMFDFGITEKINFGIGLDFRASQTDVMQDENDLRKHVGFVIGMSHTF